MTGGSDEDDEDTLVKFEEDRTEPVSVPELPRAGGSIPRAGGSIPRAGGSIPRAGGSADDDTGSQVSGVDISESVAIPSTGDMHDAGLRAPAGKQRIGPFHITGILGSGGMGMVYRAVAPDGTPAAVKVLASGLDKNLLRRFAREATIRIEHPNVVRVLAADIQTERTPYIAFELLEGQGFDARVADGAIPHQEALDVGIQACRGLSAAHRVGVVHRDLKPGNIFLCRNGTVKVLDFGIALLTDRETRLTVSGAVMGTPSYLSPEQARGDTQFDARTDVWGLGAVLYHALSGKPPFRSGSALATIVAVLMEPVEPLSRCAPSVPPPFAAVVERALAKPREERWPSMEAMLAALEAPDLVGPSVGELLVAPSLAPQIAGEQRVVAVLLAYGVRDRARLEHEVEVRGGSLLPIAGGCVVGLFGVSDWSGEEVQQAVAAGHASLGAAQRIAVTSGHATKVGARYSGGALTAAEACCEANIDGLVLNGEAARSVAADYALVEERPGIFRVRGRQPRAATPGGGARVERSTGLVGRDAELALLRRGLRTVLEEERAVVTLLSGPAGIGKGRLRQEMQAELFASAGSSASSGSGGMTATLLARGQPHQKRVALSILRAMLEGRADQLAAIGGGPRLDANAPLGERQYAVHRLAGDAIADRRKASSCAEFLGELLGVHMPLNANLEAARADPQLMLDRLRGALRDYLLGLLERGPLGLFVEELQWADEESLRFLADLADHVADLPCLVLTTARPELDPRSIELFSARDVLSIELQGLAPFDVAALARSIAGRPLSEALTRALYERTGGNPLFVEQIVVALADEGRLDDSIGALPLPLTVEAAVQSRLDHLPQLERELLKRASILARPFYFPEIAALGISDPATLLDGLVKRGILASRNRQRGERGPEFRFRSALVADVAGRMIGELQRLELHRRAASYLADLPETDAEELARHYDLGDAQVMAAKHYAIAAFNAARQGDGERVVRCAQRALELGPPKSLLFELRMAESEALQFLGRRREQRAAIEAAIQAAGSDADRARALTEMVKCNIWETDLAAAAETGHAAVEAARMGGSSEVLALALGGSGVALTKAGRFAEAGAVLAEAERVAVSCAAHVRARTAGWRAQLAAETGDLGARGAAFASARAMYLAAGDLRRAAGAGVNLADGYNRIGGYGEAERALRESLAECRKVGNKPMEGYALLNLGYSLTMLGRTDEAMLLLGQAKKIAEAIREPKLGLLARVYAARASIGGAGALAAPSTPESDAEDVALEAEGRGILGIAVSALTVAAQFRLAGGERERALVLSTRALSLLDRLGGVEEDEAEVYVVHAKSMLANGRVDEARAALERGWTRVNEIARGIRDDAVREQFLTAVPSHRELSPGRQRALLGVKGR